MRSPYEAVSTKTSSTGTPLSTSTAAQLTLSCTTLGPFWAWQVRLGTWAVPPERQITLEPLFCWWRAWALRIRVRTKEGGERREEEGPPPRTRIVVGGIAMVWEFFVLGMEKERRQVGRLAGWQVGRLAGWQVARGRVGWKRGEERVQRRGRRPSLTLTGRYRSVRKE